jgi:hypothetical protein
MIERSDKKKGDKVSSMLEVLGCSMLDSMSLLGDFVGLPLEIIRFLHKQNITLSEKCATLKKFSFLYFNLEF